MRIASRPRSVWISRGSAMMLLVLGRVALGPRAGARLMALGRDPEAQRVSSGGPRRAHLDGFDLHGNVAVDGKDHERLEQLCRYVLRPAVAQDRLRLTEDGRVVPELKTAWADGPNGLWWIWSRAERHPRWPQRWRIRGAVQMLALRSRRLTTRWTAG